MQTTIATQDMPVHNQKTRLFRMVGYVNCAAFSHAQHSPLHAPEAPDHCGRGESGVRWLEETDQSLKPIGPQSPILSLMRQHFKTFSASRRSAGLFLWACASPNRRASSGASNSQKPHALTAARILELDLERATPFKHKDVYTAFCEDRERAAPPKGKLPYARFIVKRERIDEPRQLAARPRLSPQLCRLLGREREEPLQIDFLSKPLAASAAPRASRKHLPSFWRLTALVLAGIRSRIGDPTRQQCA